jgi:hypothetical protein
MEPSITTPHAITQPPTSHRFLLFSLIAANVVAIASFIFLGGSILQALWIYWLQSVIIGVVNVFRILTLPDFTSMQTKDGTPLAPSSIRAISKALKGFLSAFFIMHYGGFHFGYAVILIWLASPSFAITIDNSTSTISLNEPAISVLVVVVSGLAFAIHHVLSFVAERTAQRSSSQHPLLPMFALFGAMVRPYARVIPMHIILIIGPLVAIAFGNTGMFIVFMLIKTLADVFLFSRGVGHSKRSTQITPTPLRQG